MDSLKNLNTMMLSRSVCITRYETSVEQRLCFRIGLSFSVFSLITQEPVEEISPNTRLDVPV
jgi:hypothetical protein